MPIRMDEDSPQQGQSPNRGGRSNPILSFLPMILGFVFRRPKLIIPVLVVGGIWYFFLGGKNVFSGVPGEESTSEFSLGANLDPEVYDRAEVFEPLTYGSFGAGGGLPASVSLAKYAPKRLHQGNQGSCVGWASSYAARTILEAETSGAEPNQAAFSPSFLYNQIALQNCQGAYMLDAMETMRKGGVLPFREYPYDDSSCSDVPGPNEQARAQTFRIKGYNRLTMGGEDYRPDMQGIKQHLAQGSPVVIGMQVGGTFMHDMRGQRIWSPTQRDYSLYGFSGHAMCVIGYDNNYEGGAFQLMNSWGETWGEKGIAWVRYKDFEFFVKEAYGLHPMGATPAMDPNKLEVQFGLVDNATQSIIPLLQASDRVFRTKAPIRKGDKFKIAIANSIECHIYVFGEETDGSSYVLFPYTAKHSPYCGITGTRLFPKDYSMTADDLGNRDRIAVLITKEAIDFKAFNERINKSAGLNYGAKLQSALAGQSIPNVKFLAGEAIGFSCEIGSKNAVGVVLEIDKK
ncbi:MAG: peptidase C1 [Saprospirales bacterium]|nr:peptidase C1 [Saprospirales bacterium]